MLLLLVIGCSLTSLTIWKVWSSRERALAEVDVHGLNLTQALNTYTEGIVRQSSPKTESARRGASAGMRKAPDRTVEGLAKSASRSRGRLLLRQG